MKHVSILLGVAALLTVVDATAAEAARRVHLRNDARLVQTFDAGAVNFRCEQMGGDSVREGRWVRDCNELARAELQRMSRDGRLVDAKVAREPLGEAVVDKTLSATIAIRAGSGGSGNVADL